jgi:hypothetical protein
LPQRRFVRHQTLPSADHAGGHRAGEQHGGTHTKHDADACGSQARAAGNAEDSIQDSSVVTRRAVTKVIAVGTKNGPECDPNYSGECVPIASDVDCGGGSGNGPAYVYGVVKVIGSDIYDLDRDNDGYGCG